MFNINIWLPLPSTNDKDGKTGLLTRANEWPMFCLVNKTCQYKPFAVGENSCLFIVCYGVSISPTTKPQLWA